MPLQQSCEGRDVSEEFFNRWESIAKTIFPNSFVDQLLQQFCSDVWEQLQQSRRYLMSEKDCQLSTDTDITIWQTQLGIDDDEVTKIIRSSSNEKEQRYKLAVAAIQKLLHEYRSETKAFSWSCTARLENESIDSMVDRNDSGITSIDSGKGDVYTEYGSLNSRVSGADNLFSAVPRFQMDFAGFKIYDRPRPSFIESKSFKDIFKCVEDRKNKVIHVYGMSTSGKSQIVRAVCQRMDKIYENLIILHVQCQPGRNFVAQKWQEFINRLEKADLLTNVAKSDIKIDGDYGMGKVIEVVAKYNLRALLVLEDVTREENKLVRRFVTAIMESDNLNFQMITVDQVKNKFYIEDDINNMDDYSVQKVSGFRLKEAAEFLYIPDTNCPLEDREKLAEVLAYSPLRLLSAKMYCMEHKESYEKYFSKLGKDKDIVEMEKKIMGEHPELHVQTHGYEVIWKIFEPQDEREEKQFKVIKMMSFLSNVHIPDLLIGKLFQEVSELDKEQERKEVKYLLTRLEQKCDASINDTALSNEYGKQLLTIHMDILHAVRLKLSKDEKATVLLQVFQAMISLVGKENRVRSDAMLLSDMLNHMNRATELGIQFVDKEYGLDEPKKENFEIQMCLSRLYEVLGFATTQYSLVTRDDNFKKAIDYLWNIACFYSGNSIWSFCLGKSSVKEEKLQKKLHYSPEKNLHETAKTAYEKLKKASEKIPAEFIERNCSRFFPVTTYSLKDMKSKLDEQQQNEMKETLEQQRHLSNAQVTILQNHGCLLKPNVLRKIYLTECIASILHSRGRQVLFLKNEISREEQKRYEWYTELGLELCKIMHKDTNIKSIFEYILVANNQLPRMMHARVDEEDDEIWERIQKSRKLAKELRDVKDDFYEHGVYKLVSGTPYTVLNAMKYLVKANTKLYKKQELARQHPIPTALDECNEVYRIAKENAPEFVVASNCIVHVGKYFAAIEEYGKALEAFDTSFRHGKGINSQLTQNPNIYAWALYNTGRAILAGFGKIEDGEKHKKEFMRKYKLLNIPKQWKECLDDMKYKLERTDFSACC